MEKATGIGGLFFRARDPEALARWYADHLGIDPVPSGYEDTVWSQQAGPTVFAPFPEDTDYFGDPANRWMINFRVASLDRMVAQLEGAGIAVDVQPDQPNGRFAWLDDPEGNRIELWEPKEPGA